MALRIRFQYTTGTSLAYSIERLSDGSLYDFADGTFKATPATLTAALAEDVGSFAGRYRATQSTTPAAQFSNGDYCVTIHDAGSSNAVVGQLGAVMYNGDDATVFPSGGGSDPWAVALPGAYGAGTAGSILGSRLDTPVSTRSAGDPWSATLPGSYGTGTAGSIVGSRLDAQVSTRSTGDPWASILPGGYAAGTAGSIVGSRLDAAVSTRYAGDPWSAALPGSYGAGTAGSIVGSRLDAQVSTRSAGDPWSAALPGAYPAGTAGSIVGSRLDAAVSTRSTYAGGPVSSVVGPVTVGSNQDKTGYTLGGSGLDAVAVEAGLNARQALSVVAAATAGVLTGAGTGTVDVKGVGVATSRITATTDAGGNRSQVVLALPS